MTDPQRSMMTWYLQEPKIAELHHGDCIGVDMEVHEIVRSAHPNVKIVVHPPDLPRFRAWCNGNINLPVKGYLARNLDIVECSDMLLAAPKMMSEQRRGSGTWHAIRHARDRGIHTVIIWPNGDTETHNRQVRA